MIEGTIDPDHLEPEGPFGEASGYMGPRTMSPMLEVTAITHRERPIVQAFISEFPPSESTAHAQDRLRERLPSFLREHCNISAVDDVTFYEMPRPAT